ncbi:hypothetical protein B7P43_G12779 [Cryptotermes secundus]|uniref:Tc1-like transposase DDE domain-containing protein n=1 Tax=Cryptotermes secundus TaxID=105785 RepID=A0A2J7QGQ9_9NEOP|nr:hypothetical protein B7P43_G12779 [Cryptotermes secundus]
MLKNTEDELFLRRVIFSDEATFHLSGKVNRHNVRIWGYRVTFEHVRDSPKVNVFCAISLTKVCGHFFFDENTVTGVTSLRMLQNSLVPQMNEDSGDYISQQDGPPPHLHLNVRSFLNESPAQRWIDRMGNEDLALQFWPPRSPDLTPCDFLLWGFVKNAVYVPPLPTNLNDLRNRITAAVNSVTQDICHQVWDGFSYRLDVIRAAGGGHIEHI